MVSFKNMTPCNPLICSCCNPENLDMRFIESSFNGLTLRELFFGEKPKNWEELYNIYVEDSKDKFIKGEL